jgi:long-chain fatty acid transport protein
MHRFRTLLSSFAVLCATSSPAWAGGFATRFANEESYPTTDSPAAAYYNPAGLAMRKGTRLTVEVGAGYRAASYDRSPDAIGNVLDPGETGTGTPQEAISANAGEASLLNPLVLPFAAVATDFGVENLGVGFSVSVPFGGQAEWDKNEAYEGNTDYPGAVDGTQRWVVIEGAQRSLYLTGAGAYRVPQANLAVGLSVNVIFNTVDIVRARNVSGTDDLVDSNGMIVEGRSLLEVSGTTFSLGAGVMWEPTPELRVGVAYQAQPGFGELKLGGTLTNKFGATAPAPVDVDMATALPDVLRVGAMYRVSPELELRASFDWQRWSKLEKQCFLDASVEGRTCPLNRDGSAPDAVGIVANIPRFWEDSWGVRAGASYWVVPRVRLQGSLGYDTSPIPDDMLEAGLLDLDKIVIALGGRFVVGGGLDLVAGWTQVVYLGKTIPRFEPLMPPSRVPSNAGEYGQSVGLFQLAVDYSF